MLQNYTYVHACLTLDRMSGVHTKHEHAKTKRLNMDVYMYAN